MAPPPAHFSNISRRQHTSILVVTRSNQDCLLVTCRTFHLYNTRQQGPVPRARTSIAIALALALAIATCPARSQSITLHPPVHLETNKRHIHTHEHTLTTSRKCTWGPEVLPAAFPEGAPPACRICCCRSPAFCSPSCPPRPPKKLEVELTFCWPCHGIRQSQRMSNMVGAELG